MIGWREQRNGDVLITWVKLAKKMQSEII